MRIIVETVLLIILSIAIVAMAVVLVIVLSKNKNNNIDDAIKQRSIYEQEFFKEFAYKENELEKVV